MRASEKSKRLESLLVLCVSLAGCAAYAVLAGQDVNWDLRNYHIYSVYAWLTGRTFFDVAPAQIQSWLSPFPHVLQYGLISTTSPVVAGAAIGALSGVNGVVLWLLIRRMQSWEMTLAARAMAGLMLILGLTGPLFVSMIGTTFADNLCGPFVLGALLAITPAPGHGATRVSAHALFVAGALLGAACGLKLTSLVYVLALTASLVLLWRLLEVRCSALLAYSVGGAFGFLVTGGYWAAFLWQATGNPMFPFYNAYFRSPMFEAWNFSDVRFVPASLTQSAITHPFAWMIGLHPTAEVPFRDARFALLAVFLPLAVLLTAFRRVGRGRYTADHESRADSQRFWLPVAFFSSSYIVWLQQFGIQRYAVSLELLSGMLLYLTMERVLRTRREVCVAFGIAAVFIIGWSRPADWTRIPYGHSWFGLSTPERAAAPTLYILLGYDPISYIIPFMPPGDRFVRISGNIKLAPNQYLGVQAHSAIERHTGPIRALSGGHLEEGDLQRLALFGLVPTEPLNCQPVHSRMDTFASCELQKVSNVFGLVR